MTTQRSEITFIVRLKMTILLVSLHGMKIVSSMSARDLDEMLALLR